MDRIRKRFLWQGGGTKWTKISKPKKKGGLGIHDLRKMNQSLLCKWWWKLESTEGLWQEIVQEKYVKQNTIAQLKTKPKNSPVWNDLLKVRDWYLKGRVTIIGNGKKIDFWSDSWCDNIPLKERFPNLFPVCREQNCTVNFMASRSRRLSFRRWLDEANQDSLRKLKDLMNVFAVTDEDDKPKWIWNKSGGLSPYTHICL